MRRRTGFWLLGGGLLLTLLILVRIFIGYVPSNYSPTMNRSPLMNAHALEFTLGEKGDTVIQRSSFSIKSSGVSSVLFYTVRNAQFRLSHPQFVLLFPPASSVLFYDNARDNYGIDEVNMQIKLPSTLIFRSPLDPEIEAYDRRVYGLVSNLQASIQAAGWKRFILQSDPRLIGQASFSFKDGYLRQASINNMKLISPFLADADYRLTWEDWQNLKEGFIWLWYADNMLLEFSYTPGSRTTGSTILDSLDIIIRTSASLSGASHPNEATRAEYADSLMGALLYRFELEEQARAIGLPILESYQDPTMVSGVPVPSMDSVAKAATLEKAQPAPPEPALRKAAGELCPRSGWWFTPAKTNSRRYIQQGTPFPAIEDSNYGTTFWQWSPDQSAPKL